jgi:hypothetical protein
MEDAVFAALFVVEDELHGDARTARPIGCHGLAAVADEVARITSVKCHEGARERNVSGATKPRHGRLVKAPHTAFRHLVAAAGRTVEPVYRKGLYSPIQGAR